MFRAHAQLLTALCVCLAIVYFLPITSRTQGTQHSLSLNGTSSYVSVPNSSSINISGPITIEAWIKVNAITSNYQEIVYRHSWQVSGTGGGYEFSITNAGKLRLDLYQSHNQYTTAIGGTTITTGTWHHVAGVWDGNQTRLYLNGVLDGSLWTTNGPASGNSPLKIGLNTGGSYYFGGLIDHVRISAAALYSSNFTPGLGPANQTRAYWKFDGQTANDFSGNGNHGTLQGGATYSTNVPAVSNNAPTVTITDPLNNTTFSAGANVVIDATATDSDGAVDKVDFYHGTTLLGTDTVAPYTFVWGTVSAGVYAVTAKATDDAGGVTISSAVTVNVLASGTQHSLSLNGTSGYVSVPNSTSINISGPITIEAWIKVNAITSNYQEIVYRHSWQVSGTGGGYEFSITNAGKLRLDLYQSHNQYTTAIGGTTITTGTWHHVAGVWDGNQTRLYLNGVLDGSLWTTNGPASGNSPLKIGLNTGGTYYFGGLIDEVRISAAALYSSNFSPGLGPANQTRAYWKFDGQTANDFSGNGNHGTLQGGATYSTIVPPTGGSQRPVPVPGGPYNGQLAQAVQFSSSGSFDSDGTITAYHWNFGDGTSSNAANPTHAYQSSGLFTATLTVTDNAGLLASATTTVSVNGASEARLDPRNATGGSGENPLSRNFNWSLPLVNLPGRAGLDLNLSLSYNSLVWTRKGTSLISFDDDRGFPAPGFRLGFPTIQTGYLNAETGKWSYLLIGSDGSRTELRSVPTTSVFYESADSSHLLLDTTALSSSDPKMVLRTTDGTQLIYKPMGAAYECTEIKDSNGNYITVNYNSSGDIANIHDTLDRTITFVYDNGWLTSIEQQWKKPSNPSQQITHTWASFSYTHVSIQTNLTAGIAVSGPANGTNVKMLTRVTLDDNSTTPSQNSHYDFEYTPWGQVWKISNFAADDHLLNYRSYKLPGSPLWSNAPAQSDCPRFTERRDWAEKWNQNVSDIEQEAITTYSDVQSGTASVPGSSQSATFVQVTKPDQTFSKIYFLGTAGTTSGWRVGLPYLVDSYDVGGTSPQRQVATTWAQDDELKSYIVNPRVRETNVYDASANRKRTEVVYQSYSLGNGMTCQLPQDVREYDANAGTVLRTTRTLYIDDAPYLSRRIIGLPKESLLYEGAVSPSNLRSKREFIYDETGSIEGNDAPVQHDAAYSSSFFSGRGNVSTVKRYNVDNLSQFTSSTMKYNTAGAMVSSKDALNHESKISYADSFSDGATRNTLAYPTKLTDADGYYSTSKYNYDFGGLTYQQTPPPNVSGTPSPQPPGPEQTFEYYDHGSLKKQLNLVNNAYTRFEYASSQIRVDIYTTIQDGLGEAHSFKFTDGHGRVIATAADHTGSVATLSGQKFVYDVMGRVIKRSNPAETSASGAPSQWATEGNDASPGWIYTQQTYDWKGRPLVTTNQDGTTKTATYAGCGCAGGDVVTLTDEGTIDGGLTKRRQKKIYSDVLGRTVKTEALNWEAGSPYSTTVSTYNVRDQVTLIRQYAGAEGSGTFQDTTMSYDGYGRLKTRHIPQQDALKFTSYSYYADDRLQSMTDARGATTNYQHNNRHLLTNLTYSAPSGIIVPAAAAFGYDAAGNRLWMTDGLGRVDYEHDQLSRMTGETRAFNDTLPQAPLPNNKYKLTYTYNLGGGLSSLTDPFGAIINYGRNSTGQLTSVTGSSFGGTTTYASNAQYRAWGALKHLEFGNGQQKNTTFDSGLKPTSFTVSGVAQQVIQRQYQYYADGRLRYVQDQLDPKFDRLHQYDHVGRIREGRTGAEARGQTESNLQNLPYHFSYTHDAFGNMTGRTGTQWVINNNVTQTFTNDRPDFVLTDADGRHMAAGVSGFDDPWVISDAYQYDAAGQMATIDQWGDPPPNASDPDPPERKLQTLNSGRDGDGLELKQTVIDFAENGQQSSSLNKYYIRSTLLGGDVVSEVWGDGRKTRTFVHAGGGVLAWQVMRIQAGGPDVPEVWWNYQDPGGTAIEVRDKNGVWDSWKGSYSGISMTKAELDPMGTDVGWSYGVVLPPPPPPSTGNFGGGFGWPDPEGDPEMPDGRRLTCVLDGHRTPCANAWNVLRGMGIGVEAIKIDGPFAPILSPHFPVTENRRWIPGTRTSHVQSRITGEDWSEGEVNGGQSGHFVTAGFEISGTEMLDAGSKDPCTYLVRFDLRDESRDGAPTKFPFINRLAARAFDAALQEINQEVEGGIGFNEVFRSSEHQAKLYDKSLQVQQEWDARPWYNKVGRTPPLPANRPGTSAHEAGLAVDIPLKYLTPAVLVIFEKHGFSRAVPNDPIHLQWSGWNRLLPEQQKNIVRAAQQEYSECHGVVGR